jgi:TRAP-type C4-dicarboxylate transport system permease small subunit
MPGLGPASLSETMLSVIEWLSRQLARLTGIMLVLLASGIVMSLLISIFFRYVVGQALSWPEEISLIMFTWLVLLGGSLGVREGFHVRLKVFTDRLPVPLFRILERFTEACIMGFGIFLAYGGVDLVRRTATNLTPTLRLPMDWLHYSVPSCGILIALHALAWLLRRDREGWQ